MSEQTKIEPRRTEEDLCQSIAMPEQAVTNNSQEENIEEDIFIDDLIKEFADIAMNYTQKGGQ